MAKKNLNIYSAVLNMLPDETILLVQKYRYSVLVPPGGVSLLGNMYEFSDKERRFLFASVLRGVFEGNGEKKSLYDISEKEISFIYNEILSNEVKEDSAKFNAVLEALQEQGILYPGNLQLLHYEKVGEHEKFFFMGKEYIFFSIKKGKLIPNYISEDKFRRRKISGEATLPRLGKDFYQQDGDIEHPHVFVSAEAILGSFESRGDLSKRFGRGAHRVALRSLFEKSGIFLKSENIWLAPAIQYVR